MIKHYLYTGILAIIGAMAWSASAIAGEPKPCQLIAEKSLPGTPRPFIFNHAHIDNGPWWWLDGNPKNSRWQPQSVPVNSCVRIQLPSQPTQWVVTELAINGVKTNTSDIKISSFPNQNRYIVPCKKAGITATQCPSQIQQFELNALQKGTLVIRFSGSPPALIPVQLAKTQDGFKSYTLTLIVTDID